MTIGERSAFRLGQQTTVIAPSGFQFIDSPSRPGDVDCACVYLLLVQQEVFSGLGASRPYELVLLRRLLSGTRKSRLFLVILPLPVAKLAKRYRFSRRGPLFLDLVRRSALSRLIIKCEARNVDARGREDENVTSTISWRRRRADVHGVFRAQYRGLARA